MDYHMESKLATIAKKFQDLEQELNEVDGGITWNELAINYNGHPLKNIDEYVDDVKAGVYDDDFDYLTDSDEEDEDACGWYDEEKCGDCKKTITDWVENCKRTDELLEYRYQCESCRGIMHATFNKTLYCDKCRYEEDVDSYKAKYNK